MQFFDRQLAAGERAQKRAATLGAEVKCQITTHEIASIAKSRSAR
jgi:hypothetical protein